MLSVETHIFAHIQNANTAFQIWTILKSLYEDKGLTRKIGLLRTLISVRLDDCDNMQEYIDQIVSTSNKLTGIGFGIGDEWLGAILLAGLNDHFKPFIMGIESNNGKLSGDAIISKLLDMQSEKNSNGEAFLGKKSMKFSKKNKAKNKKCYICGSESHFKKDCNMNKHKTKNDKSNEKKHAAFTAIAMACHVKPNEWYIDSGCSNHMTPVNELIREKKKPNVSEILAANNASMKVVNTGNVDLKLNNVNLSINDVLHVPDLSANLLSVSRMCEKGNKVVFDEQGCKIYTRENDLVSFCKPENGIYKLKSNISECMNAVNKSDDLVLWHRRLGHMNYDNMKKMRDGAVNGVKFRDGKIGMQNCDICAEAKQNRLPFGHSNSTTKEILELVHSDLAGPMETKTIGGARYMLTFIDDYSRKIFVYFLKEKSAVLRHFIEFKVFVENQTERKIKTFRTDNGTEYCSNDFDRFCAANGIQHQLTNAYTPEQNGLAERYNRTIVEKAKCLLFDAQLHKRFWAESCNMAAYILNRSTNASNGKMTPNELWSNEKPNLANLRIFGSEVMVHIPKQKRKNHS